MSKHLCILYAYLLITCINAFAQPRPNTYAGFIQETRYFKNDTNKVLRYLDFVEFHQDGSLDSCLYIIKQAKELSVKLNYQNGIVLSIYRQGNLNEVRNNFPSALRYYKEAARIAGLDDLYNDTYLIYNSDLNIYYYLADYPDAMDVAQKGLALAEQYNSKQDQAHYVSQAGFIYLKQEKADESIKYCTQYLALANEIGNRMMVADASSGIADGYLLKKDYKTALIYFFKALNIYNQMHGDDGERIDRTREAFKHDRVASALLKISTVYKQDGDYKQALHYSLMILELYDKAKHKDFNSYDVASYYINAGDIYSELKNYKHAGIFLSKGLSIARSILHREDMRDAYEGLSKNFAFQKRYDSAYYYHILFTRLKDSIINERVSTQINNLEVARRDKEIALLNQQQKLKATETARQNITRNFFIGFIALVTVIAFLLLYIQHNIKVQRLVAEKQSALQIERQRISSDMHDDIGTGLSTMLIYINMLKLRSANKDDVQNIDRIASLGTALVDQMKEIVWSLSPGNDRLDSLLLFIRQYFVLLFEPLGHSILVVFPAKIPDIELKSELRRNVFLCVKEALNNVIKHANATNVELNVEIRHHILTIVIKDNGDGIATAGPGSKTGNGLKNIRRRMEAINGKFSIINNSGTVVTLELELPPYPNG